ncbi:hypothetical protein MNBD_CHLOROFLEXI01-250 [hydrothermal vent metagenome]|uniref:Uncharacterized protein n=1 Tax=hydrothermal vent metagenome TaxID=652676 RepID=A0A3B0VBJ9_9ZZZZ
MKFNFGPIARTSAGGSNNTINMASFSLHVMLNALVGSTTVEEFVAWLWHDLYKPAFHWVDTGKKDRDGNDKLNWNHIPGIGAFDKAECIFTHRTAIRKGLVSTHHFQRQDASGSWLPRLSLLEPDFISDQGDQINLGATTNYVQLSIASEPALPTVLVRSVIANAFIEVVTKSVANVLRQAFINGGRKPIEQVKFAFDTIFPPNLSPNPDDNEIWDKLGQKFDVQLGSTFLMQHFTPVTTQAHQKAFATTFTADLTGKALLPQQMMGNVVSLAELLTLYQDSRTIIMAVPQAQLYTLDPAAIKQATLEVTRKRLDDFNVLTIENGIDYLEAAFDAQIDIREIPGRQPKRQKAGRPLENAVLYPAQLLANARKSPDCRICRLSGTPFVSDVTPVASRFDKLFSPSFVDTEFVGIGGDIAPLTYLYVLNSPNAGGAGRKGVPKRTSLRGSFALFAPASQFAVSDQEGKVVEIPPLDKGGRFKQPLNRITVTTQEFTLFQQMSRRIIAQLWQSVVPNEHLPLPYLGAILLTHTSRQRIRDLLPQLDALFADVSLKAYPFELKAEPAIEIALEAAVRDSKHASKHTLLKTSPRIITVGSKASIPLLTDDDVQTDVNKALFARVAELTRITDSLTRRKRKLKQKELWLKLVLTGSDPVTAVLESAQAATDTKKLPKGLSLDSAAFNAAEKFWDEFITQGNIAQSWEQYEQLNKTTASALEEFPILPILLQAFQKKETKGETNESTN